MNDHVGNRILLLKALRRELVGPDPVTGAELLDIQNPPVFKSFSEMHGPWIDSESKQEIIAQDTPTKRYGVGVLHPAPSTARKSSTDAQKREDDQLEADLLDQSSFPSEEMVDATVGTPDPEGSPEKIENTERARKELERAMSRVSVESAPDEAFDTSGANGFRPSGMAISFLAEIPQDGFLKISLPTQLPVDHHFAGMLVNGRYCRINVKRQGKAKKNPTIASSSITTDAPTSEAIGSIARDNSLSLPSMASAKTEGEHSSLSPAMSVQTTDLNSPNPTATGASQISNDTLWGRIQIEAEYEISVQELLAAERKFLKLTPIRSVGTGELNLSVEVLARPVVANADKLPRRLITVNLINRTPEAAVTDDRCLFQSFFSVRFEVNGTPIETILPYPKPERGDSEERSNDLLYRQTPTFAAGHGCAADWKSDANRATEVRAECLPLHELPSITPDIQRKVVRDGAVSFESIDVPMRGLAGLDTNFNIAANLQQICDAYAEWIEDRQAEVEDLPSHHRATGDEHLQACNRALGRMRMGLTYLLEDSAAMQAFKWANHAILLQQIRGDLDPRPAKYVVEAPLSIRGPYPKVSSEPSGKRGRWRAFQIAFLLLSVESTAKGEHPDREVVDLIWFPTGGGKTEAYLGLCAFGLFMRRLTDPDDTGVHTLMRYTLRLLTAQQFQRATGLMCSMEYLRRQHADVLGVTPFSAGIWVGGENTPNWRKAAVEALIALEKGDEQKNPFLITKCPWCGAQMGPFEHTLQMDSHGTQNSRYKTNQSKKRRSSKVKNIFALGYERRDNTVALHCSDRACDFYKDLPIYVIDEDIYDYRPSLIIGTVDKFAMLAWRPAARSIFGIGQTGEREVSPPGLIIQDELHLIAGPLGSMAGLFEGVVEELCTDRREGRQVKPKLVCSTATIRAYREQVRALYARKKTELFPPPGLEVSDSFFAQYAREEDNSLRHGRIYVGVNGPGHGSMQTTQVRTFSALLQFPKALDTSAQDPWWTLLTFFNSLRELGTTVTLFQSDIPDYLKILNERYKLHEGALRNPWNIKELTGRLDSESVPRAIKELEVKTDGEDGQSAIDVCMASNIIEVGVDIGRLSLLAIVGQPKTTSQYIQVSGRVGRQWQERPGVVVMLYNASKPRDRSHFEKFRTYHEQLYAQVEPTSVTPFSPPALTRGLRAALVAYVRQLADMNAGGPAESPKDYPEAIGTAFAEMLLARVDLIDPAERQNLKRELDNARNAWIELRKEKYTGTNENPGLITSAGSHVNPGDRELTWMTPQSMRNVDATCDARITKLPEIDRVRRSQKGSTDE